MSLIKNALPILLASLYVGFSINLIIGYFFSNTSNCSPRYPLTIVISVIPTAKTASNNVSIILFPFTLIKGLDVFSVTGTILEPKPAAMKTAFCTR